MSGGNLRKCILCGTKYRYCPHCAEYESWPSWYNLFHDENCHEIWYTLSDFESKLISTEEAREKISNLDISVIINEGALRSLSKLMDAINSVESESSKTEQPVQETKPNVENKQVNDPFTRPAVPLSKAAETAPAPAKEEKLSVSEELKKHDSAKAKSKKK